MIKGVITGYPQLKSSPDFLEAARAMVGRNPTRPTERRAPRSWALSECAGNPDQACDHVGCVSNRKINRELDGLFFGDLLQLVPYGVTSNLIEKLMTIVGQALNQEVSSVRPQHAFVSAI